MVRLIGSSPQNISKYMQKFIDINLVRNCSKILFGLQTALYRTGLPASSTINSRCVLRSLNNGTVYFRCYVWKNRVYTYIMTNEARRCTMLRYCIYCTVATAIISNIEKSLIKYLLYIIWEIKHSSFSLIPLWQNNYLCILW